MSRVSVLHRHLTASRKFDILQGGGFADGFDSEAASAASAAVRAKVGPAEWALRVDLAAAYRICALEGWDDSINNHFTVRIPGTQPEQFLINCFGMGFDEVTAGSLVKVDTEGNVIEAGSHGEAVNRAGFVIHSCVHAARPDACAVFHTHEKNVTSLSAMDCGLLPLSQTALLCGDVSYHDYEGIAISDDERASLGRDFGDTSNGILILRNHGVLTCGLTVAEAFTRLYYIHKAAAIQVKTMAAVAGGGARMNAVKPAVHGLFSTGGPQGGMMRVSSDLTAGQ